MYAESIWSHQDLQPNTAVGVVVIALDWYHKRWWFKPTFSKQMCNEVNSLNIDKVQPRYDLKAFAHAG
jgi:hypothetical protein